MRLLRSCASVAELPSSGGQRVDDPSPVAKLMRGLLTAWLVVAVSYIALIPVSNNFVLYPLILSLAGIATLGIIGVRPSVNPLLLVPASIWFVFVSYGTTVALISDGESWPRILVFFLFWPVVYSLIVIGFKRHVVKIMFYSGAIVTVVISLTFLAGALIALGITPFESLPFWTTSPLGLRYVVGGSGAIALTAHSLPLLLWWGAMRVASLVCGRNDLFLPPMWLRFFAGALAIAAAVIAWRRGILLVLLLVPIIMLVIWLLPRVKDRPEGRGPRLLVPLVRVIACFLSAGLISMGIQRQVTSMLGEGVRSVATVLGLESSAGLSQADLDGGKPDLISDDDWIGDRIRASETRFLTDADSTIDVVFGHGIGASFDREGIDRSIRSWQTELQYQGLYYWTGLTGILLLLAIFIFPVRALRRAFRSVGFLRGSLFVSCIGAAAVLIGNATNPYMQASRHMWPVFFPFMIAGVILSTKRTSDLIAADCPEPVRSVTASL